MNYLDFEEPIKEFDIQLKECLELGEKSGIDVTETSNKIRSKLKQTIKDIYNNLTPWQKVQISRHPDRPYTLDYINNILGESFLELHGDRNFREEKLTVKQLCLLDSKKAIIQRIGNTGILEWLIPKDTEKL